MKIILSMCLLLLVSGVVVAGNGDMLFGTTPKSRGMGGTGVGYFTSEFDALAENPAMLGQTKSRVGDGTFDVSLIASYFEVHTNNGLNETYHRNETTETALPQFGVFYNLSDRVKLGGGIFVAAGSGADYQDNVAKSNVETFVVAFQVAPSASFKITDGLNIGGGPIMYYTQAKANGVSPVTGQKTNYKGDNSIDPGFQVGVSYKVIKQLTVGAHYNHGATAMIHDYADMTMDGNVNAVKIGIPGHYSLALGTKLLNETLGFTLEYKRVLWTSTAYYEDLGWKDSHVFAFGIEYLINDVWGVRAGVNYGKTPIQDVSGENGLEAANVGSYATTKQAVSAANAAGSNGSEWHFGFGGNYKFRKNQEVIFGYAQNVKNESVRTGNGLVAPATPGPYKYKQKGYSHQFDLAYSYRF